MYSRSCDAICRANAATATEDPPGNPQGLTQWEADQLRLLDKYMSNGLFDYTAAREDSAIDRAFLSEFSAAYFAASNDLQPGESQAKVDAMQHLGLEHFVAIETMAANACVGRTGWRNFWPTIYLNSCQASALSNLTAMGAWAAGLTGLIAAATGAPALVAGAIAAGLTFYTGLYGLCNSWGRGINIYVNPTGGPAYCWSQ